MFSAYPLWEPLGASGGLWGPLGVIGGSWGPFGRFLPLCPAAHKNLHIDVLPVASSSRFVGIVKAPFAREVYRFWKIWTPVFGLKAVSPRKTHGFWCVRFWLCFSKGPHKTRWCALSPFGLQRATFQAAMQNTAVRRDWRSVCGLFWPK